MSEEVLNIKIDELSRRVGRQDAEIALLREAIEAERSTRAREERSRLIAGVMALGSIVTALIGVIWAYRGLIFQGKQ